MIRIVHRFTCSACGLVHEQEFAFGYLCVPPVPCAPAGWRRFRYGLLCPSHEVVLQVDGQPREFD